MPRKKDLRIVGSERERLLIALQMHDMVGGLNLAIRVRKLEFILAYDEDHFARCYLAMPGIAPQQIMLLDQRKHACYITPPSNRELFHAFLDITERLHKLGGRLALTGDRPAQGPKRAILQIYVDGAHSTALTLLDTTKGKRKTDTSFQLPDGTTP